MALWTPPTASEEQVRARLEATGELLLQFERDDPLCRRLQPEWTALDPRLFLARARGHVDWPGIKPGFFYVLRFNEGAPMSYDPIETKDGGFLEPTSGTLDEWRSRDSWNRRAREDRAQRLRDAEVARERRLEREREDRRQEALERWQAVTRAQVSMNRSSPWSQSHAGRRGRKT